MVAEAGLEAVEAVLELTGFLSISSSGKRIAPWRSAKELMPCGEVLVGVAVGVPSAHEAFLAVMQSLSSSAAL